MTSKRVPSIGKGFDAPGGVFLSMRITSAPISANIMAAKGQGPRPTISMTRKPVNGPLMYLPISKKTEKELMLVQRQCIAIVRIVGLHLAAAHQAAILDRPTLQRTRNNLFHNFIGAPINALHSCINIHLRNWIFKHITVTAKKLQTLINDFALQIRNPVFRHR